MATSADRDLHTRTGPLPGSDASLPLPAGRFLVAGVSGRVMVLNERGQVVRRIPGSFGSRYQVQAVATAPDRHNAYVAVYAGSGSIKLYELDLRTGGKRQLTLGLSPALDPSRTKLAYVSLSRHTDLTYERALVVRDLRSHRTRSVPFPTGSVPGTPPELVINWSPDGRRIALLDGRVLRLVDAQRAGSVDSQPALPGTPPDFSPPCTLIRGRW